jgi:hypothetical protein
MLTEIQREWGITVSFVETLLQKYEHRPHVVRALSPHLEQGDHRREQCGDSDAKGSDFRYLQGRLSF